MAAKPALMPEILTAAFDNGVQSRVRFVARNLK